ncbi:MAG: DsrE family protein [Candidatus Thermoplasmatota archaeon]|nr:DsrE family protein [Candidatus Sysuiplasma jiujiangense]MBX8639478.1 DsrE family protein [Candidatus Sysuiplasma jiujiangense]MBX8641221.1 DsrE family protein [Candidatus Sysuiplasma jiujiangense]MCL5253524.1 DsrE family protein [Candidatus Thermoplasmatota archaeon]
MKIAVVLGSNSLEKVEFAAMTAFLASSMGDETEIFATMDGVQAFRKVPLISSSGDSSRAIKENENGGRYGEYLAKAKATGRVKVIACSMASKLFNLRKEDYTDVVDSIGGLTSFLAQNEGSKIMSIW